MEVMLNDETFWSNISNIFIVGISGRFSRSASTNNVFATVHPKRWTLGQKMTAKELFGAPLYLLMEVFYYGNAVVQKRS